jgi:D-serine deaminase-like pyridoxal phosphate-dependent protein
VAVERHGAQFVRLSAAWPHFVILLARTRAVIAESREFSRRLATGRQVAADLDRGLDQTGSSNPASLQASLVLGPVSAAMNARAPSGASLLDITPAQ